jgi:hypothetical protein
MFTVFGEIPEIFRMPPWVLGRTLVDQYPNYISVTVLVNDVDGFHLCWNTWMDDRPHRKCLPMLSKPLPEAVFYEHNFRVIQGRPL